jgi:hypothetical protein
MAVSSIDSGFKKSKYIIMPFTVKNIEVTMFRTNPNSGKMVDISLEIDIEREKKDGTTQTSKLFIDGNYKKNINNVVEGWGSAFKIKEFILACNPGLKFETDDAGRIPDDVWQKCIEKEIYVLKYLSTKDNGEELYRTYSNFDKDMLKLEQKFIKDVSKDKVYKYTPKLSDDESVPFPESDNEPVI